MGWNNFLGMNRRAVHAALMFLLTACSDGGCGGCGGCGVNPIAGGFPIDDRIPNAAQARLTQAGIEFLEQNADAVASGFLPGGLQFEIPEGMESFANPLLLPPTITVTICPGGGCFITGSLDQLDITVESPNVLSLAGDLRVRTVAEDGSDNPLRIRALGSTCNVTVDTARPGGMRDTVRLNMRARLVAETEAARLDYTKLEVLEAALDSNTSIEEADINVTDCSGLLGGILTGLLNSLRTTLIEQLENQVGSLIQNALGEQLCTTHGETRCPDGTFSVPDDSPESVCRFQDDPDAECVPVLLGADGEGDLGTAFLGSVSPGAHAPGQFLLAAGGDGQAINDGMSLNFFGGFRSTTADFMTTPGHNPCVPEVAPPESLPMVPELELLRQNTVDGLAGDPHVGIGLSEGFLNHAGYGLFDSGMLCIAVGTSLSQQLSTGLFSLVLPSLRNLVFPGGATEVSIALRPQAPPVFEVGNGDDESLLIVGMDQAALDFYVWTSERYVRFMTYQADLTLSIDLGVENGEVVPMVTAIDAQNSVVSNSELLEEDPAELATVVRDVLTGFATMLTSGIGGIALPDLMGLQLQVPEGGIRGVSQDESEFVAIFANLAIATPAAYTQPLQTRLELGDLVLNRHAMQLSTWREGELPSIELQLDADAPEDVEVEFSWRIDEQNWSPWSTDRTIIASHPMMLFQARHEIEARARAVGFPTTVDPTPSRAELVIDVTAPDVDLLLDPAGRRLAAWDLISEELTYRWRVPAEEWTAWEPLGEEVILPSEVEVEVRDESGNIGSQTSALIRGRPNPIGDGACACRAPGIPGGGNPGNGLPISLLLLGLVALRRRWLLPALLATIVISGCDCGSEPMPPMDDASMSDGPADDVPPPSDEPLEPGQLATHLDMAPMDDGTLILSGYAAGKTPGTRYGDLVVGRYDSSAMEVEWALVDGIPSVPPTNNPDGFRDGISTPGDDVGLWTSVIVQGSSILVAHYDQTNGDLRVSVGNVDTLTDRSAWQTHIVESEGDTGRYASLVQTSAGFAVAYMQVVPPTAIPGRPTSRVRVASASGIPANTPSWTTVTVAEGEIPCRDWFCPEGSVCTEAGECTMPTMDCTDECARDEVCINGACDPVLDDGYVESMPVAIGLYNSLATTSDGLALAYYDRTKGDLMGVRQSGNAWAAPFLIDGYSREVAGVGDSGIGADLAVDGADIWHLSYVDGAEEALRYATVAGTAIAYETIDDGTTDGTTPHDDGRHVVGDDSSIVITDAGEVRVAYQDATDQHAMFARQTGAATWAVEVLDDTDSAGYWTSQVLIGGTSHIAHWWRRQETGNRANGVRVATIN